MGLCYFQTVRIQKNNYSEPMEFTVNFGICTTQQACSQSLIIFEFVYL